jgi:hypothetical protein
MFYEKNDFKIMLGSKALAGCTDLRSACRRGFDLYFKGLNELQSVETYSLKQLRFVKSRQSDNQFGISFKGAFTFSLSVDIENGTMTVSPFLLSDKVLTEVKEGNYVYLVQVLLNAFADKVLAYHNLDLLNVMLEKYKPLGSPYTVQFSLNSRAKDRFVSQFSEDLIEWCVLDDYPQTLQNVLPRDLDSLKEFIRKNFYNGFDALSEALRGQSTLWSDYLAGRPPTGVTYNPMRLVGALALELEETVEKRCRFLYKEDESGEITLYQRDGEVYEEVLRFDKETGELGIVDGSYVLAFNSEEQKMEKIEVILDESA